MYDAIIVGARIAGSPLAMLLARKGYKVLLVDKSAFPSDIISTHYIHQPGLAYLKRWGLLERVRTSNCPSIRGLMFDVGAFALEGSLPECDGVSGGLCPRRKVLDNILVEAAAEAGTEVRERFCVRDVTRDGEQVTGIRAETSAGQAVTERARIVVGADGQRSQVARAVGASEYLTRPTVSCNYYTYFSGVPTERAEIYNRDYCGIGVFPTNDNLTLVFAAFPNRDFRAHRDDLEAYYFKLLKQVPALFDRVMEGKREERFTGTIDLPGFFRRSWGPGWALAGDAGYHKHPISAQGITDGFRDAANLAEAIDNGLSGVRPLEVALADYANHRDQTVLPMYEMTCEMATLAPPPPEMQQLFEAIRGNQDETNRFLGTITGTTPIPEFFAPENIRRIIERG